MVAEQVIDLGHLGIVVINTSYYIGIDYGQLNASSYI